MKAIGKVIRSNGKLANVVSERSGTCSMCQNCESHGACHAELVFGDQNQSVEIVALNTVSAKTGDTVELESSTGRTLAATALLFVLPIIISLMCYVFAQAKSSVAYIPAVALVASFLVSFITISKLLNKYYQNNYTAQIVKIIEESEE